MDSVRANAICDQLVGTQVGGWTIAEKTGFGKSAIVFRATRDTATVAIKVFDPELVERFGKDAQLDRIHRELALKGENHPHLVTILDGGECPASGYLFVAMQYYPHPTMADLLHEIPRDSIWPLVEQVADAARFLENRGLVHRDIKPDNIAVLPDFSACLLLDLGVLRPVGVSGFTDDEDQRVFVGTLQYSSPEFLLREEEDTEEGWRALTFYQLGAVLHDLIMRRRIFADFCSPYARLVEAVKYELPQINASDVSPDLVLLAGNCLSKCPRTRLQLVQWEDFKPHKTDTTPAAVAKGRIRKRQQRARIEPRPDDGRDAEYRKVRTATEKILSRLQDIVRYECISSSLFPPIEVREWQCDESHPDQADFSVSFAPSLNHALARTLTVVFGVRLLDALAPAVRIEAISLLTTQPFTTALLADGHPVEIHAGVFEDSIVEVVVRNHLYTSLDKAQESDTACGASPPEVTLL